MAFSQVYANRFFANLNGDADITFHEAVAPSDDIELMTNGDVNCWTMDFTPLFEGKMHRTQILDFGIVVEGQVEMRLDDGSRTLLRRGNVAA